MRPFEPLLHNPHILTILGNFWSRHLDRRRFPETHRFYATEPGVEVLAVEQSPPSPVGDLVLLHGLEGSHAGGYMVSLTQDALEAGYRVTRLNMRSCGGTEERACTLYNAGLTADLAHVLSVMRGEGRGTILLVGFSLGGNVVLKFAGERGEAARELADAVCAVSTPLDLAECVREIDKPRNYLYQQRFVSRLKERYQRRHRADPELFPARDLSAVRTVYQFDDLVTAPSFGFGTADNYYATQSARNFLSGIRIPCFLIQAKDDPMIPFHVYTDAGIERNQHLSLLAVDHGGHLGFLSRNRPRFWVDGVILEWAGKVREQMASSIRHPQR